MATALCRLLVRRGVRVAPFKAQNMSNNSFPCVGGGEIGRAQAVQAEACGLAPEAAMNPVLLKPMGDSLSQVIVDGKVWKTIDARDYYQHARYLRERALAAYENLARRFDTVVMEGAGSVAEVNLHDRDFANLSLAAEVGARALLVADIERGGVFASILGTLDLLPPEQRRTVRAFAVNKFRGDRSLFAAGAAFLEEKSGLACLGVFPFADGIHLDAEDSQARMPGPPRPNIAIVRFPRISNTTDFRLLAGADWIEAPAPRRYDFVILPGTKSTIADLEWLRATGLADWVVAQHDAGARIIGVCGGYQMLGERIDDPDGVDGASGSVAALGLLPARTVMSAEKTTRTRRAATSGGASFDAYEIHMGRTGISGDVAPFAVLDDGAREGAMRGRVIGTYLHGALESAAVVEEIFGIATHAEPKPAHYDALADWLEANASSEALQGLIG